MALMFGGWGVGGELQVIQNLCVYGVPESEVEKDLEILMENS